MNRHSKKQDDLNSLSPVHLSPEQADHIWKEIMNNLDLKDEPSPAPRRRFCYYHVLRRYIAKNLLILSCVFLLLFFVMPGTLVPASISNVSAAAGESQSSAVVEFNINTLIPVQHVSAKINNQELLVQENGYHNYSIDVPENGYLLLEVYSITGMYSSQNILIDSIDDEAPHIVKHYQEGDTIKAILTDGSGVGIDYTSITIYVPENGVYSTPLDYNEKEGYVVLAYPNTMTYITVSDKNGNQMTAVLSPPEGSS